jgi:hypothetical protein
MLENIGVEGFSTNSATGVASHVAKVEPCFGHSTKKMRGLLFLTLNSPRNQLFLRGNRGNENVKSK